MLWSRLGLVGRRAVALPLVGALPALVLACASTPAAPSDSGSGSGGIASGGGTAGGSGGLVGGSGGAVGGSGGAMASGGSASGGGASGASGGSASGGSASGGGSSGGLPGVIDDGLLDLLVFSRTTGYRHESIEAGVGALQGLADEGSWQLEATEDPARFTDESLSPFDVVVFLSTTGDVLDAEQKAAFERFIQAGKGYVGVHSASDTEFDWPWYGELVGAYFDAHPAVQEASITVEDALHPATLGLSSPWIRTDEWYGFQTNPRSSVQVLLSLDETSYDAGEGSMGGDHPIAWCHEYDGGRAFYTALGHTTESYGEPEFLQHLAGGIEWAGAVE